MAITPGQIVRADDFIASSAGSGDSGRVPKLNASGQIDLTFMPAGIVFPYAGSSLPTGWLATDGSAVSRTTYAGLFSVIGTAFGAGDGSTTFNVPDLRGSMIIGTGTKSNTFVSTFNNSSGVDTSTDILTTAAVHSFYPGDALVYTTAGTGPEYIDSVDSGTVSIDSSGYIGIGSYALPAVNDKIYITSQSSTNLSATTTYYVISASGGTFTVSGTLGGSIAGTGNPGGLVWQKQGPLLTTQTLYAIPVTRTTLRVSLTLADARAGTYINFTGTGSGTGTLTHSITLTARALGEAGGEEEHKLTIAEGPAHTHTQVTNTDPDGSGIHGTGLDSGNLYVQGVDTGIESSGGDTAHNNMSPYVVLQYIIKT